MYEILLDIIFLKQTLIVCKTNKYGRFEYISPNITAYLIILIFKIIILSCVNVLYHATYIVYYLCTMHYIKFIIFSGE